MVATKGKQVSTESSQPSGKRKQAPKAGQKTLDYFFLRAAEEEKIEKVLSPQKTLQSKSSSQKVSPSKRKSPDDPCQEGCSPKMKSQCKQTRRSPKGASTPKRNSSHSPDHCGDAISTERKLAKSTKSCTREPSPDFKSSRVSDRSMPDEDENAADAYPIPMDQVKGQSLRDRLAKKGVAALNPSGDLHDDSIPDVHRTPEDKVKSQSLRERLAKRGSVSMDLPSKLSVEPKQSQPGHKELAHKMKTATAKMTSIEEIAQSNEEWHAKELSSLSGMNVNWRAFFNVAGARNISKMEAISASNGKGKPKPSVKKSSEEHSARWEQHFAEPSDGPATTASTPVRETDRTFHMAADTSPEFQTPSPAPMKPISRTPTPVTPTTGKSGKTMQSEWRNARGGVVDPPTNDESNIFTKKPMSTSKAESKSSQVHGGAVRSSSGSDAKSSQDLKSLLAKNGIDFTSCMKQSELQALLDRVQELGSKSLGELRKACITSGCAKLPTTVNGCVQFLLNPKKNEDGAPPSAESNALEITGKQKDAGQEARRMLSLSKWSFNSNLAWGIAVLGAGGANIPAVQRAHRALMKKLHPDKVGHSPDIAEAIELAREARDTCERALSQQAPPSTPLYLKSTVLCATPSRRRIKLQWEPPSDIEHVRRYVVSAFDANCNRAITVATLEPDYSEEMKRFVSLEELKSYIVAEEDLQKMPGLFQQSFITLQVATSNEAGQSPWASLRVPLTARR